MTLTIVRIMLLRLLNNPLELLLIFVVPVTFFSLFAMIFSHGIATGENKKVRIGIIDPGDTTLARDLIHVLMENAAIDCHRAINVTDERSADLFIRECQAANKCDLLVRVVQQSNETNQAQSPAIALITDGQNPMALAIVQSIVKGFLLQRTAQARLSDVRRQLRPASRDGDQVKSSPTLQTPANNRSKLTDLTGERSITEIDEVFSPDPPDFVLETNPQLMRKEGHGETNHGNEHNATSPDPETPASEVVAFVVQNPQSDKHNNPRVAMYAAGIAVLFLLFSATGNAATLLEEQEAGTLDRILASRAGLIHVVLGKWLGIFVLGCLQIAVMFAWADMIYGIHLLDQLPGFCVMTACTSAATASFAMFMATLSGSRAQLSALSVLIILSMSALGGSMIPRFVMSDRMKEIGKWTFNAWAIDGYQKVFWYQLPIESLEIEIFVLCGSSIILGVLSFVLSARWKSG